MFKLKTKTKVFNDGGNFRDAQNVTDAHEVMFVTYDRIEGQEYKDFIWSGTIIMTLLNAIFLTCICNFVREARLARHANLQKEIKKVGVHNTPETHGHHEELELNESLGGAAEEDQLSDDFNIKKKKTGNKKKSTNGFVGIQHQN